MTAVFDSVANQYDHQFTFTPVGRYQRDQVWKYLAKVLTKTVGHVLELNCGTGEDAVFLAQKGFSVLATDVSEIMLSETKKKTEHHNLQSSIQTQKLDLNDLQNVTTIQKYDLIFSNFGGLNCVSPETLSNTLAHISNCLKPGGRLILVLMQRYCLWEYVYFLLRFDLKNAKRRLNRNGTIAYINGNPLTTWYYSPQDLKKLTPQNLSIDGIRAIGFAVPPSYLNNFFSKIPRALKILAKLDGWFGSWSFAFNLSDHILIDFKIKS